MRPLPNALLCLLAVGCASAGTPSDPSVELARLRDLGTLAEGRLRCVTVALPAYVDLWIETLPERRHARMEANAAAARAHARSVQQGMAAADQAVQARQAQLPLVRAAAQARAQGDNLRALQISEQAARLRDVARSEPGSGVGAPTALDDGAPDHLPEYLELLAVNWPLVDDEASDRLSSYAWLQALIAADPVSADDLRVEAGLLEVEDPILPDLYARILLDAYRAPDVGCTRG